MKANSRTLGFLPRAALDQYVRDGGVLVAKYRQDQVVGYLLYGGTKQYIRLAHLCVAESHRGQGIAKQLVETLKCAATTQRTIRLRCRRDFPANEMWQRLGFIPLEERRGRSLEGHNLTLWCLTLAADDQLSLFQAQVSDEGLDAILDAQVFFDLEEPESDKSRPSKALLSDYLEGALRLWITDEMFNEINRNSNAARRKASRERAHLFPRVQPEGDLVEDYDAILRTCFDSPSRPSDESDIRQLAKAAASAANVFVTRDRELLSRAEEIKELVDLDVVSPTNLLMQLHEIENQTSYTADLISGPRLRWRRLSSRDLITVPLDVFLAQGERKGAFTTRLESMVSTSRTDGWCELLWSEDEAIALRIVQVCRDGVLSVRLARVSRVTSERELISRFIAIDAISQAVDRGLKAVRIEPDAGFVGQRSFLGRIGFVEDGASFIRYCFSTTSTIESTLDAIEEISPQASVSYRDATTNELSRLCSPIHLRCTDDRHFLVPIRPGYALSLVDRRASARDLIGGVRGVLLRWDNVYYRAKNRQHMLKPPARVLWYVSGSVGEVVAVSHLDSVEVDSASQLFRKFEEFGILSWSDIFAMCDGDHNREIMALKFSHTFSFRSPVSLSTLRNVYGELEQPLVLQSPSEVVQSVFARVFQLGFADTS